MAIGITYPLLALVGFDAQGNNSEETKFAFRMIYLVVPVGAMALAYLSIRGFKLDVTEQEKLQAQIVARDSASSRDRASK